MSPKELDYIEDALGHGVCVSSFADSAELAVSSPVKDAASCLLTFSSVPASVSAALAAPAPPPAFFCAPPPAQAAREHISSTAAHGVKYFLRCFFLLFDIILYCNHNISPCFLSLFSIISSENICYKRIYLYVSYDFLHPLLFTQKRFNILE